MPYRDQKDQREASARHYARHKPEYIERKDARRLRLKAAMAQAKAKPCMDCGGFFRAVAMDFDHRDPATKLMSASSIPATGSFRVMQEELAKCDLVCSNCHRVREELRRWGRTLADRERRRLESQAATANPSLPEEAP